MKAMIVLATLISLSTARAQDGEKTLPTVTFLYCASGDIDVYFSLSVSGCVDADLNSYYIMAAETGLTVGISSTVFTLLYKSYDGADISGTYYGGSVSGALGPYGGIVGVYYPMGEKRRGTSRRNRLFRLGYVFGASMEVAGTILTISKIKPTQSQGVGDHRNRAEAHREASDHRTE